MKRPTKLFFMSVLISATVAKAQQPTVKPYDIDLANYQYPYPVLPSKNSALVIAVTFSYRNRFAISFSSFRNSCNIVFMGETFQLSQ